MEFRMISCRSVVDKEQSQLQRLLGRKEGHVGLLEFGNAYCGNPILQRISEPGSQVFRVVWTSTAMQRRARQRLAEQDGSSKAVGARLAGIGLFVKYRWGTLITATKLLVVLRTTSMVGSIATRAAHQFHLPLRCNHRQDEQGRVRPRHDRGQKLHQQKAHRTQAPP